MTEFCELKNKEALAILDDLTIEDIEIILDNLHPSYLLRNVMLCTMVVLDFKEDYLQVSIEMRNAKSFIESLKAINY